MPRLFSGPSPSLPQGVPLTSSPQQETFSHRAILLAPHLVPHPYPATLQTNFSKAKLLSRPRPSMLTGLRALTSSRADRPQPGFVLALKGHAPLTSVYRILKASPFPRPGPGVMPSGHSPTYGHAPSLRGPPLSSRAPPTYSEAPSLVGDGPSAMVGLIVSAGNTGFLRASIRDPRPAAAPQPGPIGSGATRAPGCGLGRVEGGRRPSRERRREETDAAAE